ncbi:putative 1-aminocyclopropane-1-carboxylate oxidase [Annulohypoxylon bovei var. microspora]|nr:putative 1-aminocyclopropane-1-carboxylate oxidase [Annulohypoxylon bovei var. microspora]
MSPSRMEAPLSYEYPNETKEQLEYAELEALDISKLDQPGGKQALAEQVLQTGFFYVVGHGFSDEQVRRQYALCEAFFELPLEEKLKYACDTAKGDFRGYKPQSTGKLATRDNDERYNIPKFTPEHERPHPQLIQDHWDEIRAFSLKIHNSVLLPLLRLFAHVLEIDEDYLAERHRYAAHGLEYLRYMKYHPRTAAADAQAGNVWAKGHTDYNTLTFLFHQPVAGLQFLSAGYLRSTVHRVVRPPEDQARRPRLSLIYFARPEADILLKPVASPLLRRLGLQSETEKFARDVTAEKWARARIAKDHRFRTGLVDQRETEIIAGVNQKYYD